VNLSQDEQHWSLLLRLVASFWFPCVAGVAMGEEPGDRPWMISAQTAQGLGGKRETVTVPAARATERWLADVPETGWQYLVIHHSGTAEGSVASIHAEHRRRVDAVGNPWLGIGYHFVIGNGQGMPDGHVEATFRWKEQIHGAHSGNAAVNARGIGICLIGNFENHRPTDNQIQSLKALLTELSQRHQIPEARLLGHSDVKATACPGKYFDFSELRRVMVKTGTR
jgi:hypothetical protein